MYTDNNNKEHPHIFIDFCVSAFLLDFSSHIPRRLIRYFQNSSNHFFSKLFPEILSFQLFERESVYVCVCLFKLGILVTRT